MFDRGFERGGRESGSPPSRLVWPILPRLLRCPAGAIAPMMALLMVPIAGALAIGVEAGAWLYVQRSMQNAADSAAIAAAINKSASGSTYLNEARAAARPYGFIDGQNSTTVTAAPVTCPTGTTAGASCYQATITTSFPLTFSRVVGYAGTANDSQSIVASSIAVTAGGSAGVSTTPCAWSHTDLTSNGTPNADLTGCSVMANGAMTCNGANGLKADYALAGGNISGLCTEVPATENKPNWTMPADPYSPTTDPYKALVDDAKSKPCTSSPPTSGNVTSTLIVYCGDMKLTGDMVLKSPDTLIVVKGQMDLNNKTLSTDAASSTASATIVFTGTASPVVNNMKGTINLKAPDKTSTSGWKGVAIYQSNTASPRVDVALAGAQDNWSITGLLYLANSNVTLSGAINHSTAGATCMFLVGYSLVINGNGQILQSTSGCSDAGLPLPEIDVTPATTYRERLVQ